MPWEEIEDYIRSGHRDSSEFESDSLRTLWISEEEGIKAVIGRPEGKTATEVVSYLFLKEMRARNHTERRSRQKR